MIADKTKSTSNNQASGKSTLTSLLTNNNSTPTGQKTVIGTRRIIMTKGADGTTRVVTQPTIVPKTNPEGASSKATNSGTQKDGPQKVQIIRGPDGKLSVKGLLAGQQLIQMPDGKLHVVMAGQQGTCGQLVASIPNKVVEPTAPRSDHAAVQIKSPAETLSPQRAVGTPAQHILVQGNRQLLVQPAQPMIVQSGPRPGASPRLQAVQTVLVPGQILQRQAVPTPVQAIRPAPPPPRPPPVRPRAPATQQIVVNNPVLAQQIAAGKIQLATVNGQQVLIRPTGNNQAQIVAHIGTSPPPAPAPRPAPPPAQTLAPALTEDQLMERRLLAGQPPGTVIKTVTAQVTIVEH